MTRPYSIAGSVLFAIVVGAFALILHDIRQLPQASILAVLLFPAVILGIPFAIWLPHAQAGAMGDHWQVPSHTLLFPRWLICLIGTQMIGFSLCLFVLGISTDTRYGLLCVMQTLVTIAFVISSRRRFARHAGSEFVMPSPYPYPLRKRM